MRGTRPIPVMAVALALALVLAGCAAPAPTTPSPSPTASTQPSVTPSGGPTPGSTVGPTIGRTITPSPTDTPGPAVTPAPEQPAAIDLIEADLAAGVIDQPTAILYRLFALFGDDRLPEPYRGVLANEDDAALALALAGYSSYPAEVQTEMLPFLVRPTSPLSYWAPPPTARTGGQALAMTRPLTAAAACVGGYIRQQAAAPAQAVIWGQCGGQAEATVLAQVEETARDITALWAPMTAFMGKFPIGDQDDPNSTLDDVPESNDGLLDIYLVTGASTRYGRTLDSTGLAGTYATNPYSGYSASSYVVMEQRAVGSGALLKSLVAHEFMHSLEKIYNHDGMLVGGHWFWLVEATAQWAEYQFVDAARAIRDYPFYREFSATAQSLSAGTPDRNGYKSWMWPLFMSQEKGAHSIAAAWAASANQTGFDNLQSVVDAQLSFKSKFRDFSVRMWNEKLMPGDPIERFQGWDANFPLVPPSFTRWTREFAVHAMEPADPPEQVAATIPSLWTNYVTLKPIDEEVGQLIVDFSGLSPADALDVDMLVEIKDKGWERRRLPNGQTRFCRDQAADNVQQAIVVLSNHDRDIATTINGNWTYQALANYCADLSGTLTITRTSTYNSGPGVPLWTRDEQMTATILVDMASDPDPFGGGGYIDAGSRYQIQRTTLERRQMGNCTASYGTKSDGTWAFTDQPVGPDYENNITGYVDYNLDIAQLAIVVHYPFTATEDICNLIQYPNEGVHDLFACTGADGFGGGLTGKLTEVDGGPDTIAFDCTMEGPAMGWTNQKIVVSGTLQLADEQASPAP